MRLGTNPNISSDRLEAKMQPYVENQKYVEESEKEFSEGSSIDILGDGVHKIYMHRGQLDIYNFGSKSTKVRAARGFGKTSLLGIYGLKCVLGLHRQMGLFIGASAKQLMCRTMPNVLKIFDMMGFGEGQFYFRGQAPARLRWEMPLAKPRNWENIVHFQNGACMMGASMAVKGSVNGVNAAWIGGDETKYLPWNRVKEEVLPTLRGDFMPPEARKVELRRYGYGTDPKINNYYCSTMFVSDAGLTQKQCEWEKEEVYETKEINEQIAEMLAELKYLAKHNPKAALQLAENEIFLRKLHLLRSQSETFWNFSSIENAAMLGGEAWIRQMKRELPDLMFRIQIMGQKKGAARDGFYSNFDIDIVGYTCDDVSTFDLIADKYTVKQKGTALDAQKWPTRYETESIDFNQCQEASENCSLDTDVDYTEPLRIAIDANANLCCVVVGQTRIFEGRQSLMVMKSMFVMNERKLRSLCKDFTDYYKPFLRINGEVIFYFTATIKQGGATAYAVEGVEDNRFDKVVTQELQQMGWKVTPVDMGGAMFHSDKYQFINDVLSFKQTPALRINREAGRNDYLITAIENAGIVPGTFRKDKSKEKLSATDEDSMGGDPRTRTDITDALDDLLIGVRFHGEGHKKIGSGLRNRYHNVIVGIGH